MKRVVLDKRFESFCEHERGGPVQRKEGQGVANMSCFSHYVPGHILVMVPVGVDVPLGCSRQVPILHGALKPGTEARTYVRIPSTLVYGW